MAVGDLAKVDKPALVVQNMPLPELPPHVQDHFATRCEDRAVAITDIIRAGAAEILPIADAPMQPGPEAMSSDDVLPLAKAPKLAGEGSRRGRFASGAGGSVYMVFLNHNRAALKRSLGRTLTQSEMRGVEQSSKEEWSGMSEASKSAFETKYRQQVRKRQCGEGLGNQAPATEPPAFSPNFGIGDSRSMVAPRKFCAAYSAAGGFPSDSEVYHNDDFVVRRPDTLASGPMRGAGLRVGCCATNLRNICQAALKSEGGDDLAIRQNLNHRALCRVADSVGKISANAAEVLLLLEAASEGAQKRRKFVLLTRATMQPKSQVYIGCDWPESNNQSVDSPGLACPFEVRLASAGSRLCPRLESLAFRTSDELAADMARESLEWRAFRCSYELPLGETLLYMRVSAIEPLSAFASPARAHKAKAKQRAGMVNNPALVDLMGLCQRQDVATTSFAMPPPPKAVAGARLGCGRSGMEEALAPPLDLDLEGDSGDEVSEPEDQDGDADAAYDAQDAGELAGMADDEVCIVSDEASSQSEGGADVEEAGDHEREGMDQGIPDVVQTCAAPADLVDGPSALGYYYLRESGRTVARQTARFSNNTSVAVKCYTHGSKCTLAMAWWKVPRPTQLQAWVLHTRPRLPGDTQEVVAQLCQEHLAELRRLRDLAAGPGASSA